VVDGVGEEVVADEVVLEEAVFLPAVRQDHVVDALEGVARDLWTLGDEVHVVPERALPVVLLEALAVEA